MPRCWRPYNPDYKEICLLEKATGERSLLIPKSFCSICVPVLDVAWLVQITARMCSDIFCELVFLSFV